MDLVIALSQGLGLAVAAGFFATAPLAVASSVAALGFADGSLGWADDPLTGALLWVLAGIELGADAIWPGAGAGGGLLRRGGGGGPGFWVGVGACCGGWWAAALCSSWWPATSCRTWASRWAPAWPPPLR